MNTDPPSPAEPSSTAPPRDAGLQELLRVLGEEADAQEAAASRGQGPSLDAVLALAPDAAEWARETHAGARELALALALGARFLRAMPLPRAGPAPRLPASSAGRGAAGEDEVYRALARGRQVRDVSRRAHSGDFVCDTPAGPIHVEVKHYSSAAPAAEVDKFLRDLRETDAAAGVFLSLSSPIAGRRESVTVVLEPRVSAGTLVPVVFAAPPRTGPAGSASGRLASDVAVAAVDLAACLAAAYPRGLHGLHGHDSALAYAAAAEQLADGARSARTDLARLAGAVTGDAADLGERLAALGREARLLARSQRAEAETVFEAPAAAGFLVATLRGRFEVRAPDSALAPVADAVEALASAAGPLGVQNRWRFLKARAVHVPSGCGFSFLKSATLLRVPAARLPAGAIADALKAHPKKVGLADGEVTLELDDLTRDTALAFLDQGGAPAEGAPGS